MDIAISIKNLYLHFPSQVAGHNFSIKHINYEIECGDAVALLGNNGSGKTTLLRILAGVFTPTEGSVKIFGKIVPVIELGAEFDPDISGYQNVLQSIFFQDLSKKEIEALIPSIVLFGELQEFIFSKVRTYSKGMILRLAFSIIVFTQGDIYLFDEVITAGDLQFRKKCIDFVYGLKEKGKTVILTGHGTELSGSLCNKTLILDNGSISAAKQNGLAESLVSFDKEIQLTNQSVSFTNDSILFQLSFNGLCNYTAFDIAFLFDYSGKEIAKFVIHSMYGLKKNTPNLKDSLFVEAKLPIELFNIGQYSVSVFVIKNQLHLARVFYQAMSFEIPAKNSSNPLFDLLLGPLQVRANWKMIPLD